MSDEIEITSTDLDAPKKPITEGFGQVTIVGLPQAAQAPIGFILDNTPQQNDAFTVETKGAWTTCAAWSTPEPNGLFSQVARLYGIAERFGCEQTPPTETATPFISAVQIFWNPADRTLEEVRVHGAWEDTGPDGGGVLVGRLKSKRRPRFARSKDGSLTLHPDDYGRHHSSAYFETEKGPDGSRAIKRMWFLFDLPKRQADTAEDVRLSHALIQTPKEMAGLGRIAAGETPKDTRLVTQDRSIQIVERQLKDSERYLSIPMHYDLEPGDELQSLLALLPGIRDFSAKKRIQHAANAPRVLVGMFAAAQEDEITGVAPRPGTFWDKDNGIRLAHVCGLDRSQRKNKRQVSTIRNWLCALRLNTIIKAVRGGKQTTLEHSSPIVQKLKDTLRVSSNQAGDLRGGTYNLWMLSADLYRMTQFDSGVQHYIAVTRDAFRLQGGYSFNLYLAILNRAHRAHVTNIAQDKVTPAGLFRPKVMTLYRWAGMERATDWPGRIRDQMRDALCEMVDVGVLSDWGCKILEGGQRLTQEKLDAARLNLWLPSEVVQTLPASALLNTEKP